MKDFLNQKTTGEPKGISRRQFVKIAGVSALGISALSFYDFKTNGVSIVIDKDDQTAGLQPAQWAVNELEKSLTLEGIDVFRCDMISQARGEDLIIVVTGSGSTLSRTLLKNSEIEIPDTNEALGLVPVKFNDKQILLACGYDTRGLVYALLELADRV